MIKVKYKKIIKELPIEIQFARAILYPLFSLIVILGIYCLILFITKPKEIKIEYFDDVSATIMYCIDNTRTSNDVAVWTECGKQIISGDKYYKQFKNRDGIPVIAKLKKIYYNNGSAYVRIYDIEEKDNKEK